MAIAPAREQLTTFDTPRAVNPLQRGSQLAIVSFFNKGHEAEGAGNLVDSLLDSNFKFFGASLLIATKHGRGSYHREDTMRSHFCTNAVANAVRRSSAEPSKVTPIYAKRLKIDSYLPYGTAGRETPEALDRYDISPRDIAVSEAATRANSDLLEPILGISPNGIAAGSGLLRGPAYRNTSLIVLASASDIGSFTTALAGRDYIGTEPIANGVIFTDSARLQAAA